MNEVLFEQFFTLKITLNKYSKYFLRGIFSFNKGWFSHLLSFAFRIAIQTIP